MCYAEKLNVHDKQQSHPFFIPSKFWQNWGKNGRGNRFAGHFADPSNPIVDPLWSADHHLRATVLKHKKSNIGRPRGDSSCGASPLFIDRLKSRCVHKTCHPHTNPPSPVHRRSTLCSRSSDYIAAVFSLSWKLSSSLPLSLLRAFFLLQKGRKHYCFLLIAQMHWSC